MLSFETLFGGTDRTPPTNVTGAKEGGIDGAAHAAVVARPELCHALAGTLSALATQITQLSFFKQVRSSSTKLDP